MISFPAKCILSGEHAVLNGGKAIVTPVKSFATTLNHTKTSSGLDILLNGTSFSKEILYFLHKSAFLPSHLSGILDIRSTIPPAMGLGSSAALCVAISHFLSKLGHITVDRVFEVARSCENLFHGKSSGLDIAGVMASNPVLFSMDQGIQTFKPCWQPYLYLSSSGIASSTKQAVEKTKTHRLLEVEDQMNQATHKIHHALTSSNEKTRLNELCDGISQASTCFDAWGLVNTELRSHQHMLKKAGALATKPTGSGFGGYVLSLWEKEPSLDLIQVLL